MIKILWPFRLLFMPRLCSSAKFALANLCRMCWCYRKIFDFSYNRTKEAWLKFYDLLDYSSCLVFVHSRKLQSNFLWNALYYRKFGELSYNIKIKTCLGFVTYMFFCCIENRRFPCNINAFNRCCPKQIFLNKIQL